MEKSRTKNIGAILLATAAFVLPATAGATHSVYEQIATQGSLFGLSSDGSLVVFSTDQRLSPQDTDSQYDVYVSAGAPSGPTLVSTGPTGGNAAFNAAFAGMSEDGQHVFFGTQESLVSADNDATGDLYERFGGVTSLVTTGPNGGNGPYDILGGYPLVSADGSRVFFDTKESLVAADQDTRPDLYERSGGVTTLVTTGPNGGNAAFDGNCEFFQDRFFSGYTCAGAVSPDGTKVFFPTKEQLVAADTDSEYDFYERSGGTTTLISTGPTGGNGPYSVCTFGISKCAPLISVDGSHVFFETDESLVSSDLDSGCSGTSYPCQDVYERSGGTTILVSTGPNSTNGAYEAELEDVSDDGHVVFSTDEPLVAGDDNGIYDVYERSGGTLTQVSRGPAGSGSEYGSAYYQNAIFAGDHVFFRSRERLTSADTDSGGDIYERFNGVVTPLTIGPAGGNAEGFGCCESIVTSQDGTRVLFVTTESLMSDDNDACSFGLGCPDIYESFGGSLSLVNQESQGEPYAGGIRMSADGSKIVYMTTQPVQPTIWRASLAAPGNGYARPRGATPTIVRVVPAFKPCGSPNAQHGPPLASPSCRPPVQASDYLTIGTPDLNGAAANFTGYLSLRAVGESPINPNNGDQADVQVTAQLTDIKRKSDLSDYSGDLSTVLGLRITDRQNGAALNQAATTVDVPLVIPNTHCSPTSDSSGSVCETLTTLDAIAPGLVVEGKRSVWQLGQVQVYDGGADGDGDTTADNTLFLTQGLYTP